MQVIITEFSDWFGSSDDEFCVCIGSDHSPEKNSEYNPLQGDICTWMVSTRHAEDHPNGQGIFLAKVKTDKTLANTLSPQDNNFYNVTMEADSLLIYAV